MDPFWFWKLNPDNFTLHDGCGYEIDLEKLTTQAEWDDWIRHIARKSWGVTPEFAFRELFPKGPLKTAAAVRRRVREYARKHGIQGPPQRISGRDA
jgi:hypothetical protein